jgi:hypothetical protein
MFQGDLAILLLEPPISFLLSGEGRVFLELLHVNSVGLSHLLHMGYGFLPYGFDGGSTGTGRC